MRKIYGGLPLLKRKDSRYEELLALQNEGKISDLRSQEEFVLIPQQNDENGHCLDREVTYYPDFVYFDHSENRTVAEDLDDHRRCDFPIVRKLMLYVHGIKVKEL